MHGGKVSSRADGETSGAGARNVSDIRVDRSDMEKTEKV
ncbi:MAG: hypothetical protein QOD13_1587, partial [Thermoleophilaceae bacterium]|nr:hypothetical protein [Thermoleophilaceae bacterium]